MCNSRNALPASGFTKLTYKPPQMAKLAGVKMGDTNVVIAVSVTESSVLALDNCDMKLEILPPGHAATKIIPIATIGVIY